MAGSTSGRSEAGRAVQSLLRPGFFYNGNVYDGFSDRPDLPEEIRAQLRSWADRETEIDRYELPERVRQGLEDAYQREEAIASSEVLERIMHRFSDEERLSVLRPQAILDTELVWPLSIRDASTILGVVSENQLRDWDDEGLVVPVRWGRGSYRGYFRSHLVQALLTSKLLKSGWSIPALLYIVGEGATGAPSPVDDLRELVGYAPPRLLVFGELLEHGLGLVPLKNVPFLSALSDDQLIRIAESMEVQTVQVGDSVVSDDGVGALLVVFAGLVRLEGQEIGPGAWFGGFSVLGLPPPNVSPEALKRCTLGVLTRERLEGLIRSDPAIAFGMCRGLADRLSGVGDLVSHVADAAATLRGQLAGIGSFVSEAEYERG